MVDVSCIVSLCDGVDCVGMDGDGVRSMLGVLHRRIAASCWLKVASIIARCAIVGGNDSLPFHNLERDYRSGSQVFFLFLCLSKSMSYRWIGALRHRWYKLLEWCQEVVAATRVL